MLNSYYAELLDITDNNDVVLYGYTFKDKNIREARLHATKVCREINVVPLPTVWRINHENHVKLASKFAAPSVILRDNDHAD